MNILFTYITPFHPQRGGIGRVTDTLAREFQRRGHKVFYLIYPGLMNPFGVGDTDDFEFPTPINYTPSRDLMSQENIDFYHKFLIDNKIDVVINQSSSCRESELWCLAEKNKIPVITCVHLMPLPSDKAIWKGCINLRNDTFIEKLKRIARIILYPKIKNRAFLSAQKDFKWILERTSYLYFLSSEFYKDMERLNLDSKYSNKLCSIPNPNSFDTPDVNLSAKKKQLLFVGLFNGAKGIEDLIRIWERLYKKHPDWELVVVGDGHAGIRDRVKRLASKLARVRFEGLQDNTTDYYRDASIFCMTSTIEGRPMVLVEAQQFGVVPTAFNSFASVTDLIQDGKNGLLIKPFSLKDYVSKLDWLMTHENERRKMALNAMESVQQFDVKKVVDQWEEAIKSLVI